MQLAALSSSHPFELLFSKKLTRTDLLRLCWPAHCLPMLLEDVQQQEVNLNYPPTKIEFQVVDKDQHIWPLVCVTRKSSHYAKPLITAGWAAFVRAKNLQCGDFVRFYRNCNRVSQAVFVVDVRRCNENIQFDLYSAKNAINCATSNDSLGMNFPTEHSEANVIMTTSQEIEQSHHKRVDMSNELHDDGQEGIMASESQNGTSRCDREEASLPVDKERNFVGENHHHDSESDVVMASGVKKRSTLFFDKVPAGPCSMEDRINLVGDESACYALEIEEAMENSRSRPRKKRISLEDIHKLMQMNMRLEDVAKELGVSKSTLKRQCRDYGITQWRWSRIKENRSSNDNESAPRSELIKLTGNHVNVTSLDTGMEKIVEIPPATERGMLSDGGLAETCSDVSHNGSSCKFVVKATYKEDTIRFEFALSFGFSELKEVVSDRLGLKRFKIKYLDDDEEWILMAHESDLRHCVKLSRLSGNKTVRLLILDV